MIFAGSRVGLVDEPLAEYRVRATSLASDRSQQFKGYVGVLEKARSRNDLAIEERAVLERSLAAQQRRVARQRMYTALLDEAPSARSMAAAIALRGGHPARDRFVAGIAALLPRSAGRRLARARRELAAGLRASSGER
jgi:hypothetical protein